MKSEKVDNTGVYIVKIDKLQKEIELLQCDLDNANSKLSESIERQLKALEFINFTMDNTNMPTNTIVALRTLENILNGEHEQ